MDLEKGAPQTREALDELFSLAYEELRRLAASVKRRDFNATLSPTALVNEAWLKLARTPRVAETTQLHFKRIAGRAMRQVLIDLARRRTSVKRGGPDGVYFVLPDFINPISGQADLLALEDALQELERVDSRQAALVESRFFGGLDVAETAELLGVSEATVNREWRAAKAWLKHRLRQAADA